MANKTIYPYGVGGQTPSGIDIVDDLTTGGHDKAASAETVKELAQYVFMGSGSYGDAYDASKGSTINFPWLLVDTDEEGNTLKKMIWHTGNGKFIDAIGAEIVGKKNGITVNSDEARTITLSFGNNSVALPISAGETNYGFGQIKELANVSGYNGDWFDGISVSGSTQAKLDIDFGGMTLKYTSSTAKYFPKYFRNTDSTSIELYLFSKIKRLNLNISGNMTLSKQLALKDVELSGTWSAGRLAMFSTSSGSHSLQKVDLKNLVVTSAVTSISLANSTANNSILSYIDMRNFNTSNVTTLDIGWKCYNLKKIIIGENFSNANVTSLGPNANYVASDATIVCTSTTPPVLKNAVLSNGSYVHDPMDWVYYRVKNGGKILVPPSCADTYKNSVYIEPVEGEDVTITTDGKTTKTGWAMYADIIEEYQAGEY